MGGVKMLEEKLGKGITDTADETGFSIADDMAEEVIGAEEYLEEAIPEEADALSNTVFPSSETDKASTIDLEEEEEKRDKDILERLLALQRKGLKRSRIEDAAPEELKALLRSIQVNPIDYELGYQTDEEQDRIRIQEIRFSHENGIALRGIINRVTTSDYVMDGIHLISCVVSYGPVEVKIPIPFLSPLREYENLVTNRDKEAMIKRIANQRIGSEVDFVIKEFDEHDMVAIASRMEAMAVSREANWVRKFRGRYYYHEGDVVEARVCYVTSRRVCLEIFGIEKLVPLKDMTYQRAASASELYHPGDRVPVKIMALSRRKNANGSVNIQLEVSGKEAKPDFRIQYFEKLNRGDNLRGKVVDITDKLIWVRVLGTQIDIPCIIDRKERAKSKSTVYTPAKGQQVLMTIIAKDDENKRVRGLILRELL